jgi:hypothetical protein
LTLNDEHPCPKCGGALVWGYVPDDSRYAYLRDFTRLALFCEDCDEEVEP